MSEESDEYRQLLIEQKAARENSLQKYDGHEQLPTHSWKINPRQFKVCILHVMGKTNNEICDLLGYSQSRVSILLNQPAMIEEINRLRGHAHADTLAELKNMDFEFLATIKEHIRSDDPIHKRVATAQWGLEKLHGKAKQEVTHESGTLTAFMTLLQKMQTSGEQLQAPAQREVKEAAPTQGESPPTEADFTDWIDSQLK